MPQVKVSELEKDLIELKESFMMWDDQRRNKVDMVLKSLDKHEEYVNEEAVLKRLAIISQDNQYYTELEPAARKLFKLHFLELSRSNEKKEADSQRRQRAEKKLEQFQKDGLL